MTDAAAPDQATQAYALSANTMGHDLLAALLGELRGMPDHWLRMNEELQQKAIERIKDKIQVSVQACVSMLMRGQFAAVPADLDAITCKKGFTAALSIPKDALYRHQLIDAQGTRVLIVMADASLWLQRMDEIKAKGNQIDLFDSDYDPSVDQPGYRRDRDRVAPAGVPTWQELKDSLAAKEGSPPADELPPAADESGAPIVYGTAATEAEDKRAQDGLLKEQLAEVGIALSLGAIQALDALQKKVTVDWLTAFKEAPAGQCKIARPLWLPIPDAGSAT